MVKPKYTEPKERKIYDSLLYHMPSVREVPASLKEHEGRDPDADGSLSSKENLPFTRYGVNEMQHRLVKQNVS